MRSSGSRLVVVVLVSARVLARRLGSRAVANQWWHVVLGPQCTALCNNAPRCDSNNCGLLLPLHAGYDLIMRAWAALHRNESSSNASALCVEDAATDFPDGCLPYVAPLRTLRDECAVPTERLPYVYDGIERDWVGPARLPV